MASIFKRRKHYSVVYRYLDDKGEEHQKWETFGTLSEAKKRKAQIEYEQETNTFVVPSAKTLKELLDEYMSTYGVNTWAMSTYDTNSAVIRNYVNPVIGDMKLSDITPRVMDQYYRNLLSMKAVVTNCRHPSSEYVTAKTVRQIHKVLRTAFSQAVKWELMDRNPVEHATLPRCEKVEREIWTGEDLMRAIEVCEDDDLYLAINLAFSCSLRLGEMLGLTWDCVDISEESMKAGRPSIYINKILQRCTRESLEKLGDKGVVFKFPPLIRSTHTSLVLKEPKTATSVRRVYLPKTVAEMLIKRKQDQEELKEYITNFYLDPDSESYDFVIEANAKDFFKTKVTLSSTLENVDDVITFKITNAKVGRISGFNSIFNLVSNYVDMTEVNKSLKEVGLNMNIDLANLTITYAVEDFYNDLLDMMGDTEGEYWDVFEEIITNPNLREINVGNGDNLLEINMDIDILRLSNDLVDISNFALKDGFFNDIIDGVIDDVKSLLNASIISIDNQNVVAKYFIEGEDNLTSSEKAIIDNYKSNATFAAKSSGRYDYSLPENNKLPNIVKTQVLSQMPSSEVLVNISTTAIDDIFKSSNALGEMTLFSRDVNKGTTSTSNYKVNYVMIDRISTVLNDDNFFLILSLNLNGYAATLTLKCEKVESTSFGVMDLHIEDIYLGNTAVSSSTKNSFLSIIKTALSDGFSDDVFGIVGENILRLNIKDALDESGVMESFGYKTTFSFSNNIYPGQLTILAKKD